MTGRVLVVEDDARMAELLIQQLAALGYDGCAVGSPDAALEAVRSRRPDALVVDLALADADGLVLGEALRGWGIPMLACTGAVEPDVERRVRAAGFAALLRKPYRLAALARELARLSETD